VKGAGLPFLTFYYLGALSVGYFSGYCLLVFRPSEGFSRFELPFSKLINVLATALVIGLLAVASAGLLWRNLPHMRVTNGPAVRQFAELLAEGLPQGGAVLTDEAPRYSYILTLTRSWLQLKGREKNYMFLDTQSLLWPAYHTYLHKVYPGKWEELPADLRRETIGSRILVKRLLDLAKNTNIYYLHPSWGYYFEVFYPEPHGLVYAMKPYEREALLPPRLSDEVIAENEAFWKRTTEQALKPLLAAAGAPSATEELPLSDRILEKLHVPREKIVSASLLKSYDSRALNHWGVQMQRLGDPKRAAEHFDLALKLNPDNVVARVNLQWNKNLRAGNTASVTNIEESLGDYRAFGQAINANGPYDEPVICYFQGWIFLQLRYYRQAALSLDRVRQFWPEDLACRIALSQINLFANFPDHALEMIGEIRSRFDLTITNLADVVALESSAWFAKQEPDKAREILDTAIKENPTNALLLANATSIYMRRGEYTNALKTVERRLKLNPDEPGVLVNKAYVSIQLEDFAGAIAALDRAITLDPKNEVAVLNRAIAYLRLGRLDRAETDYLLLEKTHTNQFQIQYGLGEIAWQRKDTNEAIRRYQRYLTNAPPDSAEAKLVAERLSRLKGKKSN
jgi:tetratricopeptide (TPR) repeat protein